MIHTFLSNFFIYQLFCDSVIHKCSVFCEKTNDGRLLSKEEFDLTQLNPDSLAATAELTPRCSVRPSYRLLRPRSRENLYPAGTSHFPRPWAGHVRRGCLTAGVTQVGRVHRSQQWCSLCVKPRVQNRPFCPRHTSHYSSHVQNRPFCPRHPSHCSLRVQIAGFCPRRPVIDVVPRVLLSWSCAIWEYQCSKSGIVEVTLIVSGEKIIILHPGIVRNPCGGRR